MALLQGQSESFRLFKCIHPWVRQHLVAISSPSEETRLRKQMSSKWYVMVTEKRKGIFLKEKCYLKINRMPFCLCSILGCKLQINLDLWTIIVFWQFWSSRRVWVVVLLNAIATTNNILYLEKRSTSKYHWAYFGTIHCNIFAMFKALLSRWHGFGLLETLKLLH